MEQTRRSSSWEHPLISNPKNWEIKILKIVFSLGGADEEEQQLRASLNFQSQKLSTRVPDSLLQNNLTPSFNAISSNLGRKSTTSKSSQPQGDGGSYRRLRRKRPTTFYDTSFKILANNFAALRSRQEEVVDEEFLSGGDSSVEVTATLGSLWQVNRVNKSVAAAEMKRQYFKFRSQLPGGDTKTNVPGRWEEITSGSSSFEQISSSRSFRVENFSRRVKADTFSNRQHQRSAGETTGFSQSGKLRGNLQPFLPPDLVLPFPTVPTVVDQTPETPETSNTTGKIY